MGIGKDLLVMMTLASAGCQATSSFDIAVPDARPVAYEDIRDASGVLGYAEPLLGPALARKYQVPTGPGASVVEPKSVAGAWELPLERTSGDVARALSEHGVLDRIREHSDGQIWIADFRPNGRRPVRLLMIDGTHPAFSNAAVPEVRPGRHRYLIAYWIE